MRPGFLIDSPPLVAPLAPPAADVVDAVDVAPTAEAPPPSRCANCGAEGCDHYCPRCGQETHDLHRSLYGILGELLDAFAGWDGKIPATLWLMVRRPGALTTEFLAGRRARYLRPLRLYLTMSVVFFVSLSLVRRPTPPVFRFETGTGQHVGLSQTPAQSGAIRSDSAFEAFLARHRNEKGNNPVAWFKRHFVAGLTKLKSLPPNEAGRVLQEAFFAKVPNTVFLLLPVFALLLRVLYRRARVYYAEHFVFALHNHAFAYFAMTLAHLASTWLRPFGYGKLMMLPVLWMPVYFFVSMRRVYGGSRARTTVKFVALSMTYGTILVVAVVVTSILTLVTLA